MLSYFQPQATLRQYPLEVIGPLCSTKDGIYLAGGAPSGNIYIWEVSLCYPNFKLLHHCPEQCCMLLIFDNVCSCRTSCRLVGGSVLESTENCPNRRRMVSMFHLKLVNVHRIYFLFWDLVADVIKECASTYLGSVV